MSNGNLVIKNSQGLGVCHPALMFFYCFVVV